MLGFCRGRGLISDFCLGLRTYLTECTETVWKIKSRFFFSLQLNLKKKKELFLSSTCIARPLIYVDVSLHSNKKQKSTGACVSVECCCCSRRSRTPSLSVATRLPIKGRRRRCCFVQLHPARRRVALKHRPLLAFMCRPICSLATQTLHIITCSSLQMN